jgi:23S rRNA (uracil1939-C5)-methyltransferase
MMAVPEAQQRAAKRQFIVDALTRIGRMPAGSRVEDVVAAPADLGYRNKIELTFGRDPDDRPVLGYHRAVFPFALIDVSRCVIADPGILPVLRVAREFFLDGAGAKETALSNMPEPVRLVLRSSHTVDERLVVLRGPAGPFPTAAPFARLAMASDPGLVGVVRLVAPLGRRGGAVAETIAGRDWIVEKIHGLSFQVPSGTFLQVHAAAAETLTGHVLDGARLPGRVLELYGGIGSMGLAFAQIGARATIVDADPAAIACGRQAAHANGIASATFVCSDVLAYLEDRRDPDPPDLVVADPPRTGLGKGVADRLAALDADRIVMVSCDPATLARDVAALCSRGYDLERMTPFDLFPQTAHIEVVAWLSRAGASRSA